jgi:hypothetical protein
MWDSLVLFDKVMAIITLVVCMGVFPLVKWAENRESRRVAKSGAKFNKERQELSDNLVKLSPKEKS